MIIDKNADGYVQYTENGETKTLFPNMNEAGGGSGEVISVNGKKGEVVLDAEDVGAYRKPSGGIPASDLASNIRNILTNADNLYYKSGDVISSANAFADGLYFGGVITSNKKEFQGSIILPKSLANISSVNITKLKGSLRTGTGGYVGAVPVDFLGDDYTITVAINKTFNAINIKIKSSADLLNVNNIVVFGNWEVEMRLV